MKRTATTMLAAALLVLLLAGGPALALTGGPDDFGYTWKDMNEADVDYEWVDMSGGTGLTMADDSQSAALTLPFTFRFYGADYTSAWVLSNGVLRFDALPSSAVAPFQGTQCPLPLDDAIDGMIAFYQRDFNQEDGGTIKYATGGTAPDRWWGVTFSAVPIYRDTGSTENPDPVTVQVVLYETTNAIKVQVQESGIEAGGDTVIGLEAPNGASGVSYPGCLTEDSVPDSFAVLFTPPAAGTPAIPKKVTKWGRPGANLSFDYKLFNLGGASMHFALAQSGSAWSPTLSANELTLAAGGSSTFTVTVAIPAGATEGASDTATVTITPDTGTAVTVTAVSLVQHADLDWQNVADMPVAVESPAAAADGAYVFVVGGFRVDEISETFVLDDNISRYDTATNTWTSSETGVLDPMPGGRGRGAACAMNGKVYVPGGYADLSSDPALANTIYIYNIAGDSWTTGAAMPDDRVNHAAVCDPTRNKVFVLGGMGDPTGSVESNMEGVDTTFIYDATANSWSQGQVMSGTRSFFVAGLVDADTIMVAGGYYNNFAGPQTESYSITGNAWTPASDLTMTRIYMAGGVLPTGRLCVCSGYSFINGYEDTYECYSEPYWIPQLAPMKTARIYAAGATRGESIYVLGGAEYEETSPIGRVQSAKAERYPLAALPETRPDEAAEPVPDRAETDAAETTPDAVTEPDAAEPRPDAATDTSVDAPAEETGGGDDGGGCSCQYVN